MRSRRNSQTSRKRWGAQNRLGNSVSISGDTALVGAYSDDDNGFGSGSAYVFTLSDGVWTQQAKLLPSDGGGGQRFGWSVSVSADTAIIGARFDDDNGSESGSAYIFTRSEGVWTQQAKLLPNDGAEFGEFGYAVSITNDGVTAIIGSPGDDDNGSIAGAAYVFTREFGSWVQLAKLLPADGSLVDAFGRSVAISGDTAVAGAPFNDDNGANSGSAYVFTRSGLIWTQQAKLLPGDGATDDQFGWSISLSDAGDTALIGANWDNDNGANSGSAYAFTRSGSVWTQQVKLLAGDGAASDEFGHSVSISANGDTALIGARSDDDNGFGSGSAHVFKRSGGAWMQGVKILPGDGDSPDNFGFSVSIDGDTALVGAHADEDNGTGSGSAYVFDVNCSPDCLADLAEPIGVLDFSDVVAFLTAFATMDAIADLAPPVGVFDFSDVVAFLASFGGGCP